MKLRLILRWIFALLLLAQIAKSAQDDLGNLALTAVALGIVLFVAIGIPYILTYLIILPIKRKKLIIASNAFIDALQISNAETMKEHLLQAASQRVLIPSQMEHFSSLVDRTLIQSIAQKKIDPYLAILKRKKSQNTYINDYGVIRTESWLKECKYFATEILLPLDVDMPEFAPHTSMYAELNDISNTDTITFWINYLDDFVEAVDSRTYLNNLATMSGHDYEVFVGNIVEDCGWQVQVTKGSGDQGADVIAERDGVRIVLQCKLYASTVGNKAVQEVYAAKTFYDCGHAFVISNSTYTPSARKVAERTKVRLLHHDELPDVLKEICSYREGHQVYA